MSDLHKLAQAMCSIDLIESHWTQVSWSNTKQVLSADVANLLHNTKTIRLVATTGASPAAGAGFVDHSGQVFGLTASCAGAGGA